MPQRNDRSRSTPTTSPKNNSWFRMQAGHQSDADIYIYDEIGFWGVTAKQFISDLNALGDITHINLHINSPGGDVFEGIAIFNALKTHGASITVYVDGVAASMASVIAMVGNPVIMPENTFMMIHKPFGFTGGDAEDMRTYADLLDKVEAVLLPAYAQKTGKTTDEIAAMLADETWMTLREYARMSLTERGIGVSSYNPMQMVGAAFTHSTSDFGNILLDVANKAILQGWEDAPETYEQWTRKGQLSDFKIAHRVGMGGFSALRQVREGAEYKYVTTGDKQATIALATYGELFSITRQAIINDDLNMLTDVPMKLGRAAKSTIADLVYAILTSNPKISTDNVSLFDKAKHANVLESAAMDVASLDKARQLMRVQKEGERHLNIRPAFVLVPTAMESVANQVIHSSSVKGADINAGIINPVKDFATVIAEPRLDDNSQTTFYLAASKGSDTIEVAYLNGVDTPYIDQMEGFSVDGVTTKVRIDAGVAPVDHRGLVKCTA